MFFAGAHGRGLLPTRTMDMQCMYPEEQEGVQLYRRTASHNMCVAFKMHHQSVRRSEQKVNFVELEFG
jgi:hypothetical protein